MMNESRTQQDYRALNKQQLIADIKVVLADAEALIHEAKAQGGEALALAREKANQSLQVVKAKLAEAQTVLSARGRIASELTSEYVRSHPREAIGAAAVVGLLIGLLVSRR